MAKKAIFFWLILCGFCVFVAEAAPRIRSISFEGNHVTRVSLLLREMFLREGDEFDQQKLDRSVQAVMDLGLFENVGYYLSEDYTDPDTPVGLIDVVILVEEKYYLLILPRARVDDDELHLGIQLDWDNIWGLNHHMAFLVEDRGSDAGVSEKRQRFVYHYPNVNDSLFDLAFQFVDMNTVDENEAVGPVNRKDRMLGIHVSRWLNSEGRNWGRFVGLGVDAQYRDNEIIENNLADERLDAMIVKLRYGYRYVHEYAYNRGGKAYGYNIDFSDDFLGSDSEFVKHYLYYRSYYRFDSRPDDNLNVQAQLGHATADILGDAAFALGSSQDLRGYENGLYEGNSLFLLNMEYLVPLRSFPALRYVYFIDLGNTCDDFRDLFHKPLKTGIGFGIRWKIPKFVKLDLRIDVGYGIDDDNYHVSFGSRHAF